MSKFLEVIKSHTQKLGWEGIEQLNDSCLKILFDMGEGRSQIALITHYPHPEEKTGGLVEVSSPVLKMDGFPDGKLGKGMAEKLLRENSRKAFASWAIEETGEGPYLVAMSGWMLDDLDAEELHLAVLSVSNVADNMEKTLGVDNF